MNRRELRRLEGVYSSLRAAQRRLGLLVTDQEPVSPESLELAFQHVRDARISVERMLPPTPAD